MDAHGIHEAAQRLRRLQHGETLQQIYGESLSLDELAVCLRDDKSDVADAYLAAHPFQPPENEDAVCVPRLADLEREVIQCAVGRWPTRKPEIAEQLGISLKTLYNKINEYEIR